MLQNNKWVKEEFERKIKNYLKTNDNSKHQNLWDAEKADLRGKFIVINAYLKK